MIFIVLFLLVFGMGICITAITYILFWYEAACTPHPLHVAYSRKYGGLLRCVIRASLFSILHLCILKATYPLGFIGRLWNPKRRSDCNRPPVLLVHGLYHNPSAWCFYKWHLRRRGYGNVFALRYNSISGDFRDIVRECKAAADRAMRLCNGKPVILVGHSLGGLIIRAVIADPEAARHVLGVALLGTPHRGSKLAALAFQSLGKSLAYDGPLVRSLAERPAPPDMPKLSIASPFDNMVLPTSSLEIAEEGWRKAETEPLSHACLLYHCPTIKRVLDHLDQIVREKYE